MATCLLALGSNLGDREATLRSALEALHATSGIRTVSASSWHRSQPVIGVPNEQQAFLNGAVLVHTTQKPLALLESLQKIENTHGRARFSGRAGFSEQKRWPPRTLDIDLLLYENQILKSPQLTIPHPRMSFRRFVLEPAVEIAPERVHPSLGWTLRQLLTHLDEGADRVALLAKQEPDRNRWAEEIRKLAGPQSAITSGSEKTIPQEMAQLWPAEQTTWITMPGSPGSRQGQSPKLSILLNSEDPELAGRGPTLQLDSDSPEEIRREIAAAVEAVWPKVSQAIE